MLVVLVCALIAGVLAIAFAWSAAVPRREQRLAMAPDEGMDVLSVTDFHLIDQDEAPFSREDLRGHITVVDFIFTNCPFICPTLSRNMLHLQRELVGTGVRYLSISVDPGNDTPERLREYAASIGADLTTWTFLTGEFDEIMRLSEGGLKLALSLDPETPITLGDGSVIDNVAHTGKFVVIGPDLRVIGLYTGTDRDDVDRLAARLRTATGAR